MKLIKSIEMVDVPENHKTIVEHWPEVSYEAHLLGARNAEEVAHIHREVVRGHRFMNMNGEQINLGLSEEVYNALGLPIDCWEKDQKTISELREENKKISFDNRCMSDRFDEIGRANFWRRLVYLFKNDIGGLY